MSLRDDSNDIQALMLQPGWTVYVRELQKEFDKEFLKLRRYAKKADEDHLLRIAGKLDGLEIAQKLPDRIINRGELE
jgi:hypothetical protein